MKPLCLAIALLALTGCTWLPHEELKAPCGDTASLEPVPCDDRLPVNVSQGLGPLDRGDG